MAYKSGKTRVAVALIGAICLTGVLGLTYGQWTTDGIIFLDFIKNIVAPKLNKGDVVIMDNAAIHKVNGIKEAIEKCGARLLFLPPYSPDFSPIECMWSKLKNSLRRRDTRTLGSYHDSLNDSLSELEDDDFIGWYEHCGYRVNL